MEGIRKKKPEDKIVFELEELNEEPKVSIPLTAEIPLTFEKEIVQLELTEEANDVVLNEVVLEEEIELPVAVEEKQEETFIQMETPSDPMMPVLKEYAEERPIVAEAEESSSEAIDEKVFFEISTASDQIPTSVIDFDAFAFTQPSTVSAENNTPETTTTDTENNSSLSSGGYLAKPVQIYAEETPEVSATHENEWPITSEVKEDEPLIQMELVIKEEPKATEETTEQSDSPIMNAPVEEPALQDESEEALRRRAAERIARLRNLSFNTNTSDPSTEFETVPAYLRRNVDLTNQIADIESFYSSYTVKAKEENQSEISTLNTFLEGKKPD